MKIYLSVAAALVVVLTLSGTSCKDSGSPLGTSTPGMGTLGPAQAAGNSAAETSLVSLIFLESEEIACKSVVDHISEKAIPFRNMVWEGKPVVTLELPKGLLANPHLVFDGDFSFKASLTPEFGLSTFDGLSFGSQTVFLRDYGTETELPAGVWKVFSPGEFTDQWIGDKVAKVARVRFRSGVAGSYSPILSPAGDLFEAKQGQLRTVSNSLEMGYRESVSLVVSAPTDAETISLRVVVAD